jgi:hypothetical protein
MAASDSDFGLFCMGYMTGMASADEKFNAVPIDDSINPAIAFTCIAQAAYEIMEEYKKLRQNVISKELDKGPAWVALRDENTDRMMKVGEEITKNIDAFLKNKVDEQVSAVEDSLTRILKGKVVADKDDQEKGEDDDKL